MVPGGEPAQDRHQAAQRPGNPEDDRQRRNQPEQGGDRGEHAGHGDRVVHGLRAAGHGGGALGFQPRLQPVAGQVEVLRIVRGLVGELGQCGAPAGRDSIWPA